jgi:hypothetical protein
VLVGLLTLAVVALRGASDASTIALAPQAELDGRWGSYLSERSWGTPREAIDGDGWGLSWRGAIDADYRYGDDAIGGLTDDIETFRVGWAFWDGEQEQVSERLLGKTNPQGEAGEAITDDREFGENTPSHSYQRLLYRYPAPEPAFEIQLEWAKVDGRRMALGAQVTNLTDSSRELDVVLKGWMATDGLVQPVAEGAATSADRNDGLVMVGPESVVTIVGPPPTGWQISDSKKALDENLRSRGKLIGGQVGNIGALAFQLRLEPHAIQSVRAALAEDEGDEPAGATAAAREVLAQAASVLAARRSETADLFRAQVTSHQDLYQSALMSLLWNESYYRWDGTTGSNGEWAGRVDAHDVLIMPDKWEYPWLASWDSAFQAVTASLVDTELAQRQLRFVLSDRWQQPDGHIPCGEWMMADECPPVFAWATWQLYEQSHDRAFLQDMYAALQRNYDYWWQANEVGDALFRAGSLGMDNLPRARGGARADASAWMAFFARDMARIASELRDPATSGRYWEDRGRIQEQINDSLWDDNSGFYYDVGAGGRFIRHKSYSGLIPLIAGIVPPERLPLILGALRDEDQLMSVAGIRSLSAQSNAYQPGTAGPGVNSNWRGPVWVPINYLLVEALAEPDPALANDLRRTVVEAVERDWRATHRFHEFFDGDTGVGLGADNQSWTMLVANLIREGWPAAP